MPSPPHAFSCPRVLAKELGFGQSFVSGLLRLGYPLLFLRILDEGSGFEFVGAHSITIGFLLLQTRAYPIASEPEHENLPLHLQVWHRSSLDLQSLPMPL